MPDVFLSYSRDDQATARRFADALQREGFSVWWDQRLHSGDAFDRVTEQALKEAKAVVVLWSKASVDSRWVRAEATVADRNGTFLPVMIEPCDRPLMFELTQAPDLSGWNGGADDETWRALVGDVGRFVGRDATAPQPAAAAPRLAFWRRRTALPLALLALGGLLAWWLLPDREELVSGRAAAMPSVAVLPFVDMTAAGADSALADGIAEEISSWLAHVPGLQVVARTSAFQFRGASQDVRRVGRELGVTHIVEGSVRRGEGLVRVTAQLVAAANGHHLWSNTYNLPEADALRIEDAVSRSVAEALNLRLVAQTEQRWRALQSEVPTAYGLYLQGRSVQRQHTAEGNLRAMELYRQAIAADPRFAQAWVSLAEATLLGVDLNGRDLAAVAVEVEPLLERALELSPGMPQAIAAQGWLANKQYRLEDALALMERAIALNPNDADTQRRLGLLYEQLARPREAIERYERAAALDPMHFANHVDRCLSLQTLAQFEAAEAACARARELNASNLWGPLATSWLELIRGNLPGALQWIDRALELAPDEIGLHQQRIHMLLELGRDEEAREAVARLPDSAEPMRSILAASVAVSRGDGAALQNILARMETRGDLNADEALDLARLHLAAGNAGAAKQWLDRAMGPTGWQPDKLVDPYAIRLGYAPALIVGSVQLAAGDREAGLATLAHLDAMLERMERAGAACSGLYSLRAESLALQGEPARAMLALQQAYGQGWRLANSARTEPFLQSLRERQDFQQLLARIDAQVQSAGAGPRD